jgi:hypothetical protein
MVDFISQSGTKNVATGIDTGEPVRPIGLLYRAAGVIDSLESVPGLLKCYVYKFGLGMFFIVKIDAMS